MKKKIALSFFLVLTFFSNAQNVGIGTTTPQTTLDVKGNVRTGGNSNFILFDSASGRITWTNSNLFVTTPQYLMKHSASAEGLYSNGAQLEYRNSTGNPIFFTNWGNGNGYFSGNVGIGTASPARKLHIWEGASGITPFFSARLVVESNSHSYINLLSPDPFETGILFGSGTSATSGVISYNTTNTPKGFTFSDNGNQTRMVIDNAGNVGIGTTTPSAKLEIIHDGASTYGTALLVNQDVIGNADGPKIQFKKTMTASKTWTAGILNGINVGTFAINEDGGTNGFGTPRFTIAPGGNIGIGTTNPQHPLDINGRMRLSGTNPNDPGIWLNDAAVDRAFVGLENNNYVGFYGNQGAGWKFGMNTQTGALKINGSEGTAGQVLLSAGGSANNWGYANAHYVGESYGGGFVFYVYDNGQHGLIAATADMLMPAITWNAGLYTTTLALANGLGAGKSNTTMIISNQGPGNGSVYAARLCHEYTVTANGVTYGDWYLPSKHELTLLCQNQSAVGGFTQTYYWTSNENPSDYQLAYAETFNPAAGVPFSLLKNSTITGVRAIRSF